MKHLMLLATAVLVIQGCATPSQISADAEVRRLCAIDGGIKVYEVAKLPPERFDRYGNLFIQGKDAMPKGDYYLESEDVYLRDGNPRIIKEIFRVVRRVDGKIMGMSIRYGRGGGDIPGPWFPSSFACPEISKDRPSLVQSVFIKKEPK